MSSLADRLLLPTCEAMARADQATIDGGTPGIVLMERAAAGIASEIGRRFRPCPVLVLCGPGNNGGDGWAVARRLDEAGWPVRVASLVEPSALKGDAALAAARWLGAWEPLSGDMRIDPLGIVVDAIFGAGLARAVDGRARAGLEATAASGVHVVAVDVPSGVHGDSGQVLGYAVQARLTVTFARAKPGHWLMPGRDLAGELSIVDIGILSDAFDVGAGGCWRNAPPLWADRLPAPPSHAHKYDRGHVVVRSGAAMTGAARLAAAGARRAGAGLVTVIAPDAACWALRAGAPGVIVEEASTGWSAALADARKSVMVLGPGAGRGPKTRRLVAEVAEAGKAMVLDADALTSFAGDAQSLARLVGGRVAILTPHEGELAQLGLPNGGDRLPRARRTAATIGAIVVLKGRDTVVAAPDGAAAINGNAPAWLATAGSGDVLAGILGGLMAQGMSAFDAAAAAVWLHGASAGLAGPGLLAEDLPERVPAALLSARTEGVMPA